MSKFWQRARRVVVHILRPIPGLWDAGQTVITLLLLIVPSVAPLLTQLWSDAWTLRRGVAISAVMLILLLFVACYRVQKELDDARDSIPKLVCKGVSFINQPIKNMQTGQVVGMPVFYHLRFENIPTGTVDRHTARKVGGTVELFGSDGALICERKLHRWENQPAPNVAGKSADLMQPLDIPPSGVECKLDIAMKYADEDDFYTPTNDSVNYGGFRDHRYQFRVGEYTASIRLKGENVDAEFKCKIINTGKGNNLRIIVI
jgi:hypothetical protein